MSRRPDPEEAAKLQYELEHTRPSRNKSVVPYLALLVGVAFLLLGMAWMMQERTEASVQGLNQSVHSFETIDQLVTDNRALHEQIDELQKKLDEAAEQRRLLEAQLLITRTKLEALQSPAPSEEPDEP